MVPRSENPTLEACYEVSCQGLFLQSQTTGKVFGQVSSGALVTATLVDRCLHDDAWKSAVESAGWPTASDSSVTATVKISV